MDYYKFYFFFKEKGFFSSDQKMLANDEELERIDKKK